MAVKLADAFVQITARSEGLQKDVAKQLAGLGKVGQDVGKDVGDRFSAEFEAETKNLDGSVKKSLGGLDKFAASTGQSMGNKISSGINKTLKAGVIGVGVAAGGALAASLTKGLGRLQGIDNAQAKLAGLGHEAKAVEGIMDDALAAVKGTAFGLEDAATIAASSVAAGIKPGEDLQRTLKLTGDAATIAGTDLASMGSIINKVATSDMMQMDVANQLMDAGIPILQMVGEEMGVTADEARKLASEGKISFEIFQSALEDGLGGAALKSGDTVQGAFANMGAAAGRFGAQLLGPVFSAAPAVFGSIGTAFDSLGEKLEPIITSLGEWLAPKLEDFAENTIPKMVDSIMSAVDGLIAFGGWVQRNTEWIVPLLSAVGAAAGVWLTWVGAIKTWQTVTKIATGVQAAFNVVMAANPIMLVAMAVAALVAGLVYFFTQTETGQRVWEQFTTALADGWEWVTGKIGDGIDWIQEKWSTFTGWISTAWEGITALFQGDFTSQLREAFGIEEDHPIIIGFFFLRDTVIGVKDFLVAAFDAIWQAIQITLGVIGTIVLAPLLLAWQALSAGFQLAWESVLKPVFDAFGAAGMWLWQSAIQPAINAISAAWSWLSGHMSTVWNVIKTAVFDAWNWYISRVQANWAVVTSALSSAWTWVKDIFTSVWNTIRTAVFDAWTTYVNQVKANWDVVTGALASAWDIFKDRLHAGFVWIRDQVFSPFEGALSSLQSFFGSVVEGIRVVWDRLRGHLAKPINFMINTVYNDGILRAWNVIAGILPGLEEGSKLAAIPEYAVGGAIRGPGTGTSDDVLMWGSNGEHMMTALEVKRMGGHGHVYAMREAIRAGRPFVSDGMGGVTILPQRHDNDAGDLAGAAPSLMLPAFRDGGEIRPLWEYQLQKAHDFARSQHGKPYQWAGPTGPGSSFDCSGFMGSIAAVIQDTNPWQRYWATMSFPSPGAQGFAPGLGPGFSIGIFNGGPYGGHTSGTLGPVGANPATNVEAGGSPSMVKYGTGAAGADHPQYTMQYHLPIGADGAFVSGGAGGFDFFGAVKSWITDKVSGILDPIRSLLPSPPPEWMGIPGGVYAAGKEAFTGFVEDQIENLGEKVSGVWGRITGLFDTGGVLHSGRMAVNRSGKPEAILTNAQWGLFSKMVHELPFATESMKVVAEELQAAYSGGDWGYGELGSYIGNENARLLVDEVSWIGGAVGELSAAWAGGDDGYGSIMRYLNGNEVVARAIVDGVAILGEIHREVAPVAQKAAQDYAEAQSSAALGFFGLDGLPRLAMGVWEKFGPPAHERAWAAAAVAETPEPASTGSRTVVVELDGVGEDDLVRAGDLKAAFDRIGDLELKLGEKKKPLAAAVTRGGPM